MTDKCNSECKYCYQKSMKDFSSGIEKKFKFDFSDSKGLDIKKLKKFIKKDKKSVLVFYGGEPLLEIEKIKEMMNEINVPFRMQTNGKLLDKLAPKYLNRIEKILVSIDGTKERTDENRGKGTYDLIMKNIKLMKKNGYKGELIARMTILYPDIYEQVLFLIKNGFSSVHWQLDAGFYNFDFDKKKFLEFVGEYNKSISRLVEFWISDMKKGEVLRLYPFIAIADSLLKGETTKLKCGSGHSGYTIAGSGKIFACPITNHIENFIAGDLDTEPKDLKKFDVSGRCLDCNDKNLCGGRCLYWNYSNLWPEEGDELVCSTVKHLIKEIKEKTPEIRRLIEKNIISSKDFEYEKYFGPEIIP